jgi:hypothetical protein
MRPGWAPRHVVDSLALLEQARNSWLDFANAEAARRRTMKRTGRRAPDGTRQRDHLAWLQTYLQNGPAETWLTTGLGNCPACAHLQIHHDAYGCRACLWSGMTRGNRCQIPIPPPTHSPRSDEH